MIPSIRSFADKAELERVLVDTLRSLLTIDLKGSKPIVSQPEFAVMLSGGSTPMPAYRALAAEKLTAKPGAHLLFSDDRYVPATSQSSNYFQTKPLIDALQLDESHVFRVHTELPLAEATRAYARDLAALEQRRVDLALALVGLGADGHTCSLFSQADLARARGVDAIAVARPDGRDAVSVTPQVLGRATKIVFVVSGVDKQTAVRALLDCDPEQTAWCAVSGCRKVEIWADQDALALVA